MSDVLVQFKIKNARLMRALRESEGFVSVRGFARASGVNYQALIDHLGMARRPITKDGDWSKSAVDIANALFADPNDLWPEEMRDVVLSKTTGEFEVSIDEARQISGNKPAIDRKALRLLATTLNPREAKVIADFANGVLLRETADDLGVGVERTRQIQLKAIRRMQARAKAEHIKFGDVIDLDGDG